MCLSLLRACFLPLLCCIAKEELFDYLMRKNQEREPKQFGSPGALGCGESVP